MNHGVKHAAGATRLAALVPSRRSNRSRPTTVGRDRTTVAHAETTTHSGDALARHDAMSAKQLFSRASAALAASSPHRHRSRPRERADHPQKQNDSPMRLSPHITATALILAFGTAAAPAAAGNTTTTKPAVRSNPDQQLLTAPQRPVQTLRASTPASTAPRSETCSGAPPPSTTSTWPGSGVRDSRGDGSPNTPPTIIRVTPPGGFDWGDAGIGAAGAIGLCMLALGLVLAVSQRRTRRANQPTTSTR
jgi:hypothetical protein